MKVIFDIDVETINGKLLAIEISKLKPCKILSKFLEVFKIHTDCRNKIKFIKLEISDKKDLFVTYDDLTKEERRKK